MTSIIFRHVGKRFGDVPVIENFDLEIHAREFMVLVGPSGCGKTTALRMIAGLEDVSQGELLLGDRVINDLPAKDRDVAMVFQNYALYPHMSVRENMAFGLKIRKTAPAEIARLVDDAAGMLGLADLLDRKPKALSGGQRQRVALGRALVRKPSVFLFDEPLSNLDADLRVQMRAELSKLQQRLQTTTVYVTHDQVEAMTLGTRIAVLSPWRGDGHSNLQQVGTPLELYDRPDNVFVARFIGTPSMNLLTTTVGADGRLEGAGFTVPPPPGLVAVLRAYRGRRLLLGIRPEQVGDAVAGRWPQALAVEGPVEIVETVGHEVIVHLRVGADPLIAKLSAQHIPRIGDSLRVALNGGAVHLFDPDDGARLRPSAPLS